MEVRHIRISGVCVCVCLCVCIEGNGSTTNFIKHIMEGRHRITGACVCVCVCVEGNGNPLQYSCLGNPMDKEAWQAIVHGVTRVRDDLELNHHLFQLEASKQNINFSRS